MSEVFRDKIKEDLKLEIVLSQPLLNFIHFDVAFCGENKQLLIINYCSPVGTGTVQYLQIYDLLKEKYIIEKDEILSNYASIFSVFSKDLWIQQKDSIFYFSV